MAVVSNAVENQDAHSVSLALCVDSEALDRFGGVLRHLLVGLVDQAVGLRLVSADPRVEALTLGPIQTVVHERIAWPLAGRRMEALLDVLSQKPPTVVHAMSGASYRVAVGLAEAFDADLVVQVTSLADCKAVSNLAQRRVGRFLAVSQPLLAILGDQLQVPVDRLDLIRPGVLASSEIACFADPDRVPALLCLSALERGSGVDRLIEAVDVLRRRDRSLMLFLLGRGRHESALRRMIRDRKLASFVTLAHPSGNLTRAMYSADIFVRPSTDTAFNADGLQALGAGMAVVAMSSSVCDHLHDGETAIACDKTTVEALAEAIERLLADPALARRMATNGLDYVRAHHAVSGMAERTANTYRQLALDRATFPIKEKSA